MRASARQRGRASSARARATNGVVAEAYYTTLVYELRLYGFAENRQPPQKPPQEKENELKVKRYLYFSHSAVFSCWHIV